jgi:hypothetical protein
MNSPLQRLDAAYRPRVVCTGNESAIQTTRCLCGCSCAVVLVQPLLVGAAFDVGDPVGVVQVPLDGFAYAGFEGFFGCPAEFALDLAGVDGVAQVVAGAVLDMGDQVFIGADRGQVRSYRRSGWAEFVEQFTERVDDFDVLFFVVTADVVGLPYLAFGYHFVQGAGVVFDV